MRLGKSVLFRQEPELDAVEPIDGCTVLIVTMKTFACIALAVVLGSSPVFAATTQCRFIQSRKERNACYDQQSAAAKEKRASESTRDVDPLDNMKSEDDRLTKRLQGICRGC